MSRASYDPPFVVARGVCARYGARTALADVDFELPAGIVTIVVGSNGAGKTTLLRVLAGAIAPTAGQLEWPTSGARPHVALVAQTVALYPFMTVQENCLAAGRIEGLRGEALRERTSAAIADTHSLEMGDRQAGRLSGGFARRAATAAALMGDAPLVVLDEPTTGLDTEGSEAIVSIVRSLRAAGKTIVISTHDFTFADAVADIVLFLRKGRLQEVGAPKRLCKEIYAATSHVQVTLAHTPDAHQLELLEAMGACRLSTSLFSLTSHVDDNGNALALALLRKAQLPIQETRTREPGVALLFERFCLAEDRS